MTIDDILDPHARDLEALANPHACISYIATVDGRQVHVFVTVHQSLADRFAASAGRFAGSARDRQPDFPAPAQADEARPVLRKAEG